MSEPTISITQGDSYEEDYPHKTLTDLSDFTGKWAIVKNLVSSLDNATPENTLASGDLLLSDDKTFLALRIPDSATKPIPVGKKAYWLIVQVANVTVNFKKEIHQYPLTITAQGIVD